MSLKKLICFSLWGDRAIYTKGALLNIDEAAEHYPDWICRFYVDPNCPIIGELQKRDCEVIIRDRNRNRSPSTANISTIASVAPPPPQPAITVAPNRFPTPGKNPSNITAQNKIIIKNFNKKATKQIIGPNVRSVQVSRNNPPPRTPVHNIDENVDSAYIPAFWRFFAASDPTAEYCIFRDCDSRVNPRERVCVDEWLSSGKAGHVMRDYPAPHATETILAGMWGIKVGIIPNMEEVVYSWLKGKNICNKYVDQEFLRDIVWPIIQDSVVEHGYKYKSKTFVPFPQHKPMKYGEYVGQVIGVD